MIIGSKPNLFGLFSRWLSNGQPEPSGDSSTSDTSAGTAVPSSSLLNGVLRETFPLDASHRELNCNDNSTVNKDAAASESVPTSSKLLLQDKIKKSSECSVNGVSAGKQQEHQLLNSIKYSKEPPSSIKSVKVMADDENNAMVEGTTTTNTNSAIPEGNIQTKSASSYSPTTTASTSLLTTILDQAFFSLTGSMNFTSQSWCSAFALAISVTFVVSLMFNTIRKRKIKASKNRVKSKTVENDGQGAEVSVLKEGFNLASRMSSATSAPPDQSQNGNWRMLSSYVL